MVGRFILRRTSTSLHLYQHRHTSSSIYIPKIRATQFRRPHLVLCSRTMAASSKVQVAILDDYFNIAPPKFSHLSSKVDVVSFPDTLNVRKDEERAKLIAQLQSFSVISTMRERTPFPANVLKALPNLKLLMTTGPKNAGIDTDACKELGIILVGAMGKGRSSDTTKPKGNSLDATTEQSWALILGLAHNVVRDDETIRSGGWETSSVTGLKGKTIGLLGLGRLGTMTGKIAKLGFGMEVLAWSSSLTSEKADEQATSAGLPKGSFKVASNKQELFETADVLSIHYVLSDRSRGMVGVKELASMKKNALLINTSRGPIVDEEALLQCLREGRIGGAGLDVFDTEPLPLDSPWRTTKWGQNGTSKVLLSPHMGYVEEDVMSRWYDETAENLERYLDGQNLNVRIV